MGEERVLVTGGSGFVAGHCILRLLDEGRTVRATVRSSAREDAVRQVLTEAGMTRGDALSFVEADLTGDAGWADAVRGCRYVLHVASPVVPGRVRDENAVLTPARDGALRVLRAARAGGVQRVVLTSAFHAVGFGHPHTGRVFTEDDWSVPDGPGVDAYGRSKIFAERAAWDLVGADGPALELVTLLPVAVVGPVLGPDVSGANHVVQRILAGRMPGFPDMSIPIVDVRDVAAAHTAAMVAPDAAGQRILVTNGEPAMALERIGAILREHLGDAARRVPARRIPDLVIRLAAPFSAEFRTVAAELGHVKHVSDERMRRVLGVRPRSSAEAVLDAATSMIAKSIVAG